MIRKIGGAAYEPSSTKNHFVTLPLWQKRGVGIYWEDYEKTGINPGTQKEETSVRRRLKTDLELPMKDEYSGFVAGFLSEF